MCATMQVIETSGAGDVVEEGSAWQDVMYGEGRGFLGNHRLRHSFFGSAFVKATDELAAAHSPAALGCRGGSRCATSARTNTLATGCVVTRRGGVATPWPDQERMPKRRRGNGASGGPRL